MSDAHDRPDIERLLPDELDGVELEVRTLSPEDFGLGADLLAHLGVDPSRAAFAFGSVMRGPLSFVAIGVLPGAAKETIERDYIEREFPGVRRTVGGVAATVQGGTGGHAGRATWAVDERLFMVVTRTERSLSRFVRAVVALPQPSVTVEPRDRAKDDERSAAIAASRAALAEPAAGQERERGLAAVTLGFTGDIAARNALRASLASDPDPRVRFMAAQSLLLHEHRDHESFPAIAAFIRDLAASGDRASFDLVRPTAFIISQYVTHARLGFAPIPTDDEIAAAVAAVRDARASASRQRDAADLECFGRMIAGAAAAVQLSETAFPSPTADGSRSPVTAGRDDRPGPCPIPVDLAGAPMEVHWNTATGWGDRRVNRAIRSLGRWPRDVIVWAAHPRAGSGVMADAYVVPGCSADELAIAFADVFFRPAKGPWEVVDIDGRTIHRQEWVTGETQGTVAWWAGPGLVVRLVGDDRLVLAATSRFP